MSKSRLKEANPKSVLDLIGIETGAIVADLGCGPGFFTLPIATRVGKGGCVYAVDSNAAMLDYLRHNVSGRAAEKAIRIVNSEVSSTGIPSKSVDVAFFANVLHDIGDKAPFFKEIRRICKKDAVVVDLDWKRIKTEHGPPFGIRLSEASAGRILSHGGFTVRKKLNVGPHHYMLICRLVEHS
jgi:ubiquinone/menaquinone biosynthesis C-methylase UbiE